MRTGRAALAGAVVASTLLLALPACDHTEAPEIIVLEEPRCPGQKSPEAVLNTLIVSYQRRDIEHYAPLLHPTFIFRFQEEDRPELGTEFWTRDQDSTGTAGLFNSSSVTNITLDLTYGPAEPATELDLLGTMKIRVTPMKLTVDDVDGTTYLVEGDIQDFFFTRGAAADSSCWYIVEWRDIKGSGGIGSPDEGVDRVAHSAVTWGWIKTLYR